MRTLIVSLLFALSTSQNGGSYRVTDAHEVVSFCYGYSFKLPMAWMVYVKSNVPYFFVPPAKATIDIGDSDVGADITIIPDAESHQLGSVDKWMMMDQAAHGFILTRKLTPLPATTISEAVEAMYKRDIGDAPGKVVIGTTTIYFRFGKNIFAAILRYNMRDPNRQKYEATLIAVLQSFRPLYGEGDGSCCCKR